MEAKKRRLNNSYKDSTFNLFDIETLLNKEQLLYFILNDTKQNYSKGDLLKIVSKLTELEKLESSNGDCYSYLN